jgi:shikimate kinase
MNNVILIGMMGSGKTTIGPKLASRLGFRFVDMDALIESMQGITVQRIFDMYGEAHFRKLEMDLTSKLANVTSTVISTGGGIVTNAQNTIELRKLGKVVYLKASIEQLEANLGGNFDNRPMLQKHSLHAILKVRQSLYESAANLIIDVDGKSSEALVEEIIIALSS